MADDARLVAIIEANTKQFENALRRLEGVTDRSFRRQAQSTRHLDRTMTNLSASATTLGRTLGVALSVGAGAQALGRAADAFTRMENGLQTVGVEGEKLTETLGELERVAQKNATPIEELTKLYVRMAVVQKDLGVTSRDIEEVTEAVSSALKVQGTSAVEARGALLQLGQAFAGGIVRAEEYNAVIEGTPVLALAIARNLEAAGGSIGKLRKLIVAGEVASIDFFRAIQKGRAELSKTAGAMDYTLGQALTRVSNAFILAAGDFDKLTGASDSLVSALEGVAKVIREVGNAAGWAQDKVEEFQKWLTTSPWVAPLVDVEARQDLNTLVPEFRDAEQTRLQNALRESIKRAGEFKAEWQKTNDEITEMQKQIAAGGSGIIPKLNEAKIQAGLLRQMFNQVNREVKELRQTLGLLASMDYNPLSSIMVPEGIPAALSITEQRDRLYGGGPTVGGTIYAEELAAKLIREFESFRPGAYPDSRSSTGEFDAYRVGYGSDTVGGTGQAVTARTTTTIEEAERDLQVRMAEFQRTIRAQVGTSLFASLTEPIQAALTSVAYNYGNLPPSVVKAVQTRNTELIARAVESLPANPERRAEEAKVIRSGEFGATERHKADEKAIEDAKKKQDEYNETLKEFNDLLASEGQALELEAKNIHASSAEKEYNTVKQDLLNQLTEAGIPLTDEYSKKIEELAKRSAALVTEGEAKEKQDEYNESVKEFNDLLKQESDSIQLESRNIRASTAEKEYNIVKQDLLNRLTEAGIPLTEEYAAKIEELAQQSAALVVAEEQHELAEKKTQDSLDASIEKADALRSAFSDVAGGLASDLLNGVPAAEALANALGKVLDQLIQIGIEQLTAGLFGPANSPLGGLLGPLFGGLTGGVAVPTLHTGGVVGRGGAPRQVSPMVFAGATRYHSGGVAGLRPGEVPAILRQGEVISPSLASMPTATGMASARLRNNQRIGVDNRITVEPSPLFMAVVDSKAKQTEENAVRRSAGYISDRSRRQAGGRL
jgi:tape measure domain-containing protein